MKKLKKGCKCILTVAISLVLAVTMLELSGLTVRAAESVEYVDASGTTQTATSATAVTGSDTTWSTGWYYVGENVIINGDVTVIGDVHLILKGDCTLTSGSIIVNEGNALTIYGQAGDVGFLNATASDGSNAGIGGAGRSAGTITINGGRISARGGTNGAGIGGGYDGAGGVITINGGAVFSNGGENGAGIGGGFFGAGGTITINGGSLSVCGENGAGIGGGSHGDGGNITINGGSVSAISNRDGAGIGSGLRGIGGTIIINGGIISASSEISGADIGGGGDSDGGVIVINGGNIETDKIGGGYSMAEVEGYYPDEGTLKNSSGTELSRSRITITLNGVSDTATVTSMSLSDGTTYGVKDMHTINGKLYLYLPEGITPKTITIGETLYVGTVSNNAGTYTVHTHNTNGGNVYSDITATTHTTGVLCADCPIDYITSEGAEAHSTQAADDKAATCTTPAYCSVCKSSYGNIDPDAHSYSENEKCACGELNPAVVADITIGKTTTYYTDITTAMTALGSVTEDCTLTLHQQMQDTTLFLAIGGSCDVVLDLGGYKDSTAHSIAQLTYSGTGSLTIQNGTLGGTCIGDGVVVISSGEVTIASGVLIQGCYEEGLTHGVILRGGELYNYGIIRGCDNTSEIAYGGRGVTVYANDSGLYNYGEIYGGNAAGNSEDWPAEGGYGVEGHVTLNAGIIKGGSATNTGSGGIIWGAGVYYSGNAAYAVNTNTGTIQNGSTDGKSYTRVMELAIYCTYDMEAEGGFVKHVENNSGTISPVNISMLDIALYEGDTLVEDTKGNEAKLYYTGTEHTLNHKFYLGGQLYTGLTENTDYMVSILDTNEEATTLQDVGGYYIRFADASNSFSYQDLALDIYMVQADFEEIYVTEGLTYGDTLNVKVIPAVAANGDFTSENLKLYLGNTDLEATFTGDENSSTYSYVLSHDTVAKVLQVGANTLTVKYTGSDNLKEYSEEIDITLNEKSLTVQGTATDRAYEKDNRTVSVTDAHLTGILSNDSVSLQSTTVSGTIEAAEAGSYTVDLSTVELQGADAGYYIVKAPADMTVTITKADAYTVEAVNEDYIYSVGSKGVVSIDIGALLKADRGTTTYTLAVNDAAWVVDEAVSALGILTYEIDTTGSVGNSTILTVTAISKNYEDIMVNVNISLTDKQLVVLKSGCTVKPQGTLTYGQLLKELSLNKDEAVFVVMGTDTVVEGTLAWSIPELLPEVTTTASQWTFTPKDTDTYTTIANNVAIQVNKAIPVITAPEVGTLVYHPEATLMDILFGEEKGSHTVAGVHTEVPGKWSWENANAVPTVNNSSYNVVFTPEDKTNYETVTKTIAVTVKQATPVIKTKPAASEITYKEALSVSDLTGGVVWYSEQENVVVKGSFAWKDASEKPIVADSDNTAYTVVFTPEDTVNYKTVETEITLAVKKAESAPNMPTSIMNVAYSTMTVGEVTLPQGWAWQKADKSVELVEGKATKATAVYTGADKGNYRVEAVEISITRATGTQEEQVRAFVERMYTVALGRSAEAGGLEFWTNQLLSHVSDGAAISAGFILSPEFKEKGYSDEQYLAVLYETFFNREMDEGGCTYWMQAMSEGKNREYILSNFVNSNEFEEICASYGIVKGIMLEDGTTINPGISQFVERMYTTALERASERTGLQEWSVRIASGINTPEEVAKFFFLSEEYVNKQTSNDKYVETLYLTFMDRASEVNGKAYWVSELEKGMSRVTVLEGFANSAEFQEIIDRYGL